MEKRATTVVTSHQATENQTLLVSEPPTECRHSNTRVKDTVLENPICSRIGTIICVPYPARQVSNSWHTLDGVLPKKGRVQSHYFLLLQQSNLSDSYTIVTKPAYALSLGHSSRQSYMLFKVFEQPIITLPVIFIKEVCYISELRCSITQDTRY